MNLKSILLSFATLTMLLSTACSSEAQNTKQVSTSVTTNAKVEIIQFHSEHRCMTCNKIEKLSREVLEDYPSIPFSLVNVDDKKNEKQAEAFEAYGTSLFIYDSATGKKSNLTEFAFMNAGNEEKFIAGLKKELDKFLN